MNRFLILTAALILAACAKEGTMSCANGESTIASVGACSHDMQGYTCLVTTAGGAQTTTVPAANPPAVGSRVCL